ncbi:MAG: aldehyde dehydrogenase family protein [Hamadaea sp.]|uniref:aldehyde dehydrogenase family protein n=1 Tax=Hamadaea sp. TaxID=2024425 RepID=UPI0018458224|nr:aldehyde dehydrogenase family protein [Hamadaea sp.]NUR74343.1 aldehyde dehydrogenase family protein [Hamadaea sp.]NUT24041.1 aldehyde dehydrogenase family protein [Hamadaea sp.]
MARADFIPADRGELYIGGRWRPATGAETIPVEDPFTEQVVAHVPAGTRADVDEAVAAAKSAFEPWAALTPQQRSDHLQRLHDSLAKRADEIATTVTGELGTPLKISQRVQTGLPLTVLDGYVRMAAQEAEKREIGNSLILREPVGVVGAITPWNYPLHQVMAKLAAALAAGCTVVLKPSELTPLVAYALFDAVHEAELPPGVVNLVPGTGPVVGEAIASHSDVDMVSFTGSTATGRRISHLAADRIAKVSLELGGKSANVILDDADLARAVKVGVANAFLNSGQTCTAWTRMLVPAVHYDQACELAVQSVEAYQMGDPFEETTRLGPLVSAAQRDRVQGFVRQGRAEGATVLTPDDVPDRGYFVAPTVLADVTPKSTVAQEEIFGPVLAVIPFADDDEAVAIANDSRYGLAGAVWSGDPDRAMAVAKRLRTGAVDVNGGSFNPLAPFGGYKQSGLGRELGVFGLEEFQQVKAVQR